MKIKNYEIDKFCSDFNTDYPAILIYGEDYGLKNERADTIIKNYLDNSNNVVDLDIKSVMSSPEVLTDELSSISLLADKKVIKIRDTNDKISSIIENNINLASKDSGSLPNSVTASAVNPAFSNCCAWKIIFS